ncbi:hypothetical protein [Bifidobacterium avesanii]|uniref:Uncharacterized protein n=1 Tax=Bifidobacterium avesanii TaxID=1798157 RepID=A0A7K3TJ59_9BIFI|nr:hypothetical protein [Bifidobacterium avesanii]NEG79157.1 hypothetical protein [Bifidobacterium avesanii]
MEPKTARAAIEADETGVIAAAIEQRIARARGWETNSPAELVIEDLPDQPLSAEERICLARAITDSLGLPIMAEEKLPTKEDEQCVKRFLDGYAGVITMYLSRLHYFDTALFKPNQQNQPMEEWEFYARPSKRLLRRFISTMFLRPEALVYRRSGKDIWAAIARTLNASKTFREQYAGILRDPRTMLLMELADIPQR